MDVARLAQRRRHHVRTNAPPARVGIKTYRIVNDRFVLVEPEPPHDSPVAGRVVDPDGFEMRVEIVFAKAGFNDRRFRAAHQSLLFRRQLQFTDWLVASGLRFCSLRANLRPAAQH